MPVAAWLWFLCAAILWVAAPVLGQDRVATGEKIVAEALNSPGAYEILAHLTDRIGPRLSGSRNADLAVRWTTEQFRQWGIPVRNERVMVPRWVR
ncbi:MAG: peptidase M28, partial [Thermoanaerobaculia bacterium]